MSEIPKPPKSKLTLNIREDGGLNETARANRELLAKAYREMAAGDGDAIMRLLDPEVFFTEAPSLPYGCEARGIAEVRKAITGIHAAWRDLRAEILEYLAAGDLVIAYMVITGISEATGREYKGPLAELFRFRNGKVVEWRPLYWDTHEVHGVCGLA
jgi:ketosteroid isomerase-like protein